MSSQGSANLVGNVASGVAQGFFDPSVVDPSKNRFTVWTYRFLVGESVVSTITAVVAAILMQFNVVLWAGAFAATSFIGVYNFSISSLEYNLNLVAKADQILDGQIEKHEKTLEELRAEIDRLKTALQVSEKQLADKMLQLEDLTKKYGGQAEKIAQMRPLLDRFKEFAVQAEQQASLGEKDNKALQEGLDRIAEVNKEFARDNLAVLQQQAEFDRDVNEVAQLNDLLTKIGGDFNKITQTIIVLRKEREEFQVQFKAMEANLTRTQASLEQSRRERGSLVNQHLGSKVHQAAKDLLGAL